MLPFVWDTLNCRDKAAERLAASFRSRRKKSVDIGATEIPTLLLANTVCLCLSIPVVTNQFTAKPSAICLKVRVANR